ncbi:MAG: RNA-binding S4 domain-containing protein [Firmicutes bacterium]|nr:RNA-binding S4 domain-containing protein [Bacillota bacterium]
MDKCVDVGITTETIRLEQLLKFANITATGGEAKVIIQGGRVCVNGEEERRRGKQLHIGDVVAVQGRGRLRVVQG